MKKIIIRDNGTKKVITTDYEPTPTQQHYKEECDVNNIIKKYKQTGQITHIARSQGMYADLSSKPDYMEAMLTVMKAKDAFMTLPSEVRRRFQNDPAELLAFIEKPENKEQCIKWGIFEKPKPQIKETLPEPSKTAQSGVPS